jgi:NAD(P)-dependent dehydrogenase (short-subunit alcohol dehydrogenase family)
MEDAKAQFETNFWGAVRVVNAALPRLRERGGGHVVLMSSIGGILGIPYQAFYSASKFALEGYAESLAYEVAPFNIHVTLVEPGNFKTDFTAARRKAEVLDDDPYRAACEKAITVMERDEANGADPADVARVVEKILRSQNPPRRVSVGKFDERMGIMGKRLLPYRLFERAAKSSLGV